VQNYLKVWAITANTRETARLFCIPTAMSTKESNFGNITHGGKTDKTVNTKINFMRILKPQSVPRSKHSPPLL